MKNSCNKKSDFLNRTFDVRRLLCHKKLTKSALYSFQCFQQIRGRPLELGISCTYNRPRHSNDNAHMEAGFRLLKHGHEVAIPQSFDTLSHARAWVDKYYNWYNNIHLHSGICYITPSECFDGKGDEIMSRRNKIIEKFFESHQKQKLLVETTGKFKRWQMPKKAVVMPFYSKRSKIKNKIRASKWTAVNLQWLVKKRC